MSSKTATAPKLKIKRLIKAPPERLFAAWTTPDEIVKWFGPETCRVTSAKIDLRDHSTGARLTLELPAQHAAIAVVGKKEGRVIARYGF